jgi:Uma2 family endonuclease
MVCPAPTKRLTAEEFFEWANRPENWDRNCELERGRIVERPLSGERHGFVCGNVVGILGNYCVKRKRGYVCCNGTGIIVERNPDTVRGPDIILFEDFGPSGRLEDKFVERPSLLLVEVIEADESHGYVMRRVQEFLHFGTRLVWVVDVGTRMVVVHEPGKQGCTVEATEALTNEEVLPGFHCCVREFFALPGR